MKKHINKNVIVIKPEILIEDNGNYFVCLSPTDKKDKRDFHIEVGDPDATNIFFAMNKDAIPSVKADIYDTYIETMEKYDLKILSLLISERDGSLWFAMLHVTNLKTKESTYIDCKPSNAIILSQKLNLDLHIYEDVLDEFIKTNSKKVITDSINKNNNLERMYKMLNDYIEHEEYEKAAELKILIDNVKSKN